MESIERPLRIIEEGGYDAYVRCTAKRKQQGIENAETDRNNNNNNNNDKQEKVIDDVDDEDAVATNIFNNPREYQRILFDVAKKENTIINFGTGYGKTLIA